MIIIIMVTIVVLILIIPGMFVDDFWYILVIPIGFVGYGVICGMIPVKTIVEKVAVKSYCSTELGECRIIAEGEKYIKTDFTTVNYIIENGIDSMYLTKRYNSYNYVTESKIDLK